jgi:type III secretion protein V
MTARTYLQEARLSRELPRAKTYNDLFLALAAIAIIAMIVIPLPKGVVDVLLAISIATGVGLLLMAIYIPTPTAFSSFPSVIMITTLFRLSLSIATAKLILLEADGGQIIETFGKLIAGGNLIVGIVIFAIITIVQFLVIAKGSERVAEVGARFTLDAMPGKQLSIDADLRAGIIDKDEARAKRRELELESQLHGSLDGAMKFVKNEAIAGIIIVLVNLGAGLVIGMAQRDLSFSESLSTYSILSIGEGLVAQLPSILAAVAAGLFVTRISGEEQEKNLGQAIGIQLIKQPRVFLITGLVCFLLMWVPGFPKLAFLAIALGFAGFGAVLIRQQLKEQFEALLKSRAEADLSALEEATPSPLKVQEFSAAVPILIDISISARPSVDLGELERQLDYARENLYYELGVMFPPAYVRFGNDVESGRYQIFLFEVPTASGPLERDRLYVGAPASAVEELGVPLEMGMPLFSGRKSVWVNAKDAASLRNAGIAVLDNQQLLLKHTTDVLKRHAYQFLGIQEVNYLITKMGQDYPDLVKEMLRAVPLQKVADILRRMVQEGLSVRNLRDIFESLAEWGQREKDVVLLTEYARMGLKRYLSSKFANADRNLKALIISPELEDKFRQSVRVTNAGSYLALDAEVATKVLENMRQQLSNQQFEADGFPVVLASMDIRRYVRSLIENEFSDVAVLSYQELSADIRIQPAGQVSIA